MNEQPGATRKMDTMVAEPPPSTNEFHLTGDSVIAKIQELVHEGNVRRIIVSTRTGRVIVETPADGGGGRGAAVADVGRPRRNHCAGRRPDHCGGAA